MVYEMLKESQVGVIARIYQTLCSSYPKPQPVWHLLPIKLTSRYGKLVSKNLLMRECLGPPRKNQFQWLQGQDLEFQRPSNKASASPCSGDLHDFLIDSPSITIPLLFRHATPIPTGLEKPVKGCVKIHLEIIIWGWRDPDLRARNVFRK